MVKITPLADVNLIAQASVPINNNNDLIEQAFDNTLSRDGSGPNQMEADIDLNGNDLLNVGFINTTSLTIQGQDVSALIQASLTAVAAATTALSYSNSAAISAASASADASTVATQLSMLPKWKGPWTTSTVYTFGDLAQESGATYIAILPHTSTTFSTDLSANKWQLFAQKGSPGTGTGDLIATNNLSELTNKATARFNLGVPSRLVDSTISSNWTFEDNPTASLRFGTDQDTKLWYDNTNGILALETLNNPAAVFKARFPWIEFMKPGGSETMAKFVADGAVELFYDAVKRFETGPVGVKVTGTIQADGATGNWMADSGDTFAATSYTKVMSPARVAEFVEGHYFWSLGTTGFLVIELSKQAGEKLYIAWGRYSLAAPASSTQRVTFPITFPNGFLNCWVGVDNAAAQMIGSGSIDRFGMTIIKGNGDTGARAGWYYAMGY